MAFPDESRYGYSIYALDCLKSLDFKGFLNNIFITQARPGDAILRLMPAGIQGILYHTASWDPRLPVSLVIPQLFNLLISILLTLVFYRVSLILWRDFYPAFSATVVYSLLANSNIYVRHLLPYDAALLIFLSALFYILKDNRTAAVSVKTAGIAGALAALSFLTYPGYYYIPVLVWGALWIRGRGEKPAKKLLANTGFFAASLALVMLVFEGLARLGGSSYLNNARGLPATIIQGSFKEGYTFGVKYLVQVEGMIGLLLVICLLWYAGLIVRELARQGPKKLLKDYVFLLFILSGAGFMIHASISAIFHKMVFYGRLLHLYLPFLVWTGFQGPGSLKMPRWRNVSYALMIAASVISFTFFAFSYSGLAYPRDVLYRYRILWPGLDSGKIIFERQPVKRVIAPPSPKIKGIDPAMLDTSLTTVNAGYFYPVEGPFEPYLPPEHQVKIFTGQHFLTFPAYLFEGYSMGERRIMRERNIYVSVFK
ncbi:hypothetical protein HY768_03960 [candidate division TA06 bacterium]|uniref:Uncharacterized protein n=1 Tax=candidate division TA06 bacterium TaxID=2250710 RepID=A0A933I8A9_UNCT6|nr:hypothetical protein [candidate division TA06 bacterium]